MTTSTATNLRWNGNAVHFLCLDDFSLLVRLSFFSRLARAGRLGLDVVGTITVDLEDFRRLLDCFVGLCDRGLFRLVNVEVELGFDFKKDLSSFII